MTSEQLQAKVAELEEENARLRFALADTEALELGTSERLAASQAYAEQLRVALEPFCEFNSSDAQIEVFLYTADIKKARQAIAIPHDTSALDACVARKVTPFRDSERKLSDAYLRIRELVGAWKTPEPHTAEEVYEHTELCVSELTRQRDLAVEAMREALECGEDGDWQSARRILASAIKKSEGK